MTAIFFSVKTPLSSGLPALRSFGAPALRVVDARNPPFQDWHRFSFAVPPYYHCKMRTAHSYISGKKIELILIVGIPRFDDRHELALSQ